MSLDTYLDANELGPRFTTWLRRKRNGGRRQVVAPRLDLRHIQAVVKRHLERSHEFSAIAYGVAGRPYWDAAARHCGASFVGWRDIKDFHPSISSDHVRRLLERSGASREVVELILHVATRDGRLIQGSPASPIIAEMLVADLDRILFEFASALGVEVTRNSDDTVASGENREHVQAVLDFFEELVVELGLSIQPSKSKIAARSEGPIVHGLNVAGDQPTVLKSYRRDVAKELRRLERFGASKTDVRRVRGMVDHIQRYHGREGKRLREQLSRVTLKA